MQKTKWFIYKLTHPLFRLYWKIFKPVTMGTKAIVINNNSVLLVKNINVSKWSLPGGKVDYGEIPEACILRELKEELSLDLTTVDFKLGEYVSEKEGKKDTVFVFVINLKNRDFKKMWELQDAEWVSLDNLPIDISPATLRRLNEYKQNVRDLISNW